MLTATVGYLCAKVEKNRERRERLRLDKADARILLKLSQALSEDLDIQSEQSTKGEIRKLEPEWLERFLKRTFFDPCSEHQNHKNELNRYCIDCDEILCQYCLSPSHAGHRLLKMYRHVYKEVVQVDEIERHIDCSKIQPYRCNKHMVIALTPLPHCGGNTNDEITCLTCKRKLIEYHIYSYCSISCKVEAFIKKEDDNSPPFLLLNMVVQKANQGSERKRTTFDPLVQKAKQGSERKTTVDQQVKKAKHGSERKKTTVDKPMHKAKHGPEPKKPTVDHRVQKAKHGSEMKTSVDQPEQMEKHEPELEEMNTDRLVQETPLDQLVQMADQEPELKVTMTDQAEEMAKPDSPVNKRKRKRKGIPYRAPFF